MQVWKRAFVGLAALFAVACGQTGPVAVSTEDMTMGAANAPVTVVEYASPTCPVCKMFHDEVQPTLKTKYIDTGKVKFVFREYPSHNPPLDVAIFQIARCAGPDKYFAVMDDVYARQQAIEDATRGAGGARSTMVALGQKHGLSAERAAACISDAAGVRRVSENARKANAELGVNGTPTIFVDGEKLSGFSIEEISAKVDAKLAAVGK